MKFFETALCRVMLAAMTAWLVSPLPAQEIESAPQHEIGLTLGGFFGSNRKLPQGPLELGGGAALQANYGYKFVERSKAALYGEVHFLASPQRLVSSIDQSLTRDIATIYVTPGIRVKFFPRAAMSPYFAVGGGYAVYEQSLNRLDGQPNPAPRTIHRGAFDFGAGVDVKFWRFVGLRGEIRDFYSGSPAYNAPSPSGQHNVMAGGGFVLRFR